MPFSKKKKLPFPCQIYEKKSISEFSAIFFLPYTYSCCVSKYLVVWIFIIVVYGKILGRLVIRRNPLVSYPSRCPTPTTPTCPARPPSPRIASTTSPHSRCCTMQCSTIHYSTLSTLSTVEYLSALQSF